MTKILFLTTSHHWNDDRIFFHQAKALKRSGLSVKICSLSSDFQGLKDEIDVEAYEILDKPVSKKAERFRDIINSFQPHCIICSEPLAVISARKYCRSHKAVLIYDITEWYPSARMVQNYAWYSKGFHLAKFLMIQVLAGLSATHFIFGEPYKMFPLAGIFFYKPKILLPYFPDEKYIFQKINDLEQDVITLCYTGTFAKEKGIENFFAAVDLFIKRNPEVKSKILLIGRPRASEVLYFHGLLSHYCFKNIEIKESVDFENFTKEFSEADICFDLRPKNIETSHSLPIKIFYYLAAGKPVVYSSLKSIKQFMDASKFGYLVNPERPEEIVEIIEAYLHDPGLYRYHAKNAVKNFVERYNWGKLEPTFVNFVQNALQAYA